MSSSNISRNPNSHKASFSATTPDTLINLAMKKDVSGILQELENLHSNSQADPEEEISPIESESDLATLAANLFFITASADIASIEQCCDIFDLVDEQHPVLAQQGYSKLLELSLSKDHIQLVCYICTRLLSQDIRLDKSLYDNLLPYLTGSGQVEQALNLAHSAPPSKQALLSLVEPLFLSSQHMQFADLFRQYCLPFNNEACLSDVNLVVTSMMWAKGLCHDFPETEREAFVASVSRSLDAYRDTFHDMAASDPHYSRVMVNKLFRVLQGALHHVFLSDLEEDAEETAGIVSELRRKFVSSRHFAPFPYLHQDDSSSTNFPAAIPDITAQVAARKGGDVSSSEEKTMPFFLSNYLWQQDYADIINGLVEEREDGSAYYNFGENDDDDFDNDAEGEETSGDKYASTSTSSSEDDDSADEDVTELSINLEVKISPSHSQGSHVPEHKQRLVDMEAHFSRCRDDLVHSQELPDDTHANFPHKPSVFHLMQLEHHKILFAEFTSSGLGMSPESLQNSLSPQKAAICDKMDTLGYLDEEAVETAMSSGRLVDEGGSPVLRHRDLSSQCQSLGTGRLRLARDIFGYSSPHHHFSENAYDSIKFIKDEVKWG